MSLAVVPAVEVDWDNDGAFTGTGEDVSARVRNLPGVRTVRGLDIVRGVKPPRAGTFDAELDNTSKDYSPEYTGSPLAGLLEPGRALRCRMVIDAVTVGVFRGILDDLPQNPDPRRKTVGIPALGTLSTLVGKTGYSTQLFGDGTEAGGVRSDVAMHRLLDAIGDTATDSVGTLGAAIVSTSATSITMTAGHSVIKGLMLLIGSEKMHVTAVSGNTVTVTRGFLGTTAATHLNGAAVVAYRRVFDEGQTVFFWWWLDLNEEVAAAARAIVNSEGPGAAFFEDGDGRKVLRNRFHRTQDSASVNVQATVRDSGAEPLMSRKGFQYDRGLRHIVNSCTVTHVSRAADALGRIWDPGPDAITLAAGEVKKFTVVDAGGDPFKTATVPVLNTDYKVDSGGSVASMTLDRTSGSSCVLTITAGSSGATIRNLELRAQAVRVLATTRLANTVDASASIAKYGDRPYTLQTRGEIGLTQLQSLCNAVVALWKDPRPIVSFVLENAHADRVSQFVRDIGHRIALHVDQVGLSGTEMHIDQIGFHFTRGGRAVDMSIHAEKVTDSSRYFVIGTDVIGGPAVLGY